MGQSHIEVAIESDPAAFDEFVGIMTVQGFEGFWEDGSTLRAYIPGEKWTGTMIESLHAPLARIASARSLPPPRMKVMSVEDRNWNEVWEATIRPIRVTDRIIIAPSWHPPEPDGDVIVLTIDPKMSFGTGYHETTRLMLKLIERHLRTGDTVLDVGTGTGVLAIAALKLGALRAVGVDNDDWSFANARENAVLNGVAERLAIRLGDLAVIDEKGFGMIVANIQKNVIEAMLPDLVRRLAPAGRLLLSGLLLVDRDAMLRSLAAVGLNVIDERTENEWVAFAATR